MNAEKAKKIDFPNLLSSLGFEPVKVTKGGNELWYKSPFRAEKEPSFHTSYIEGKWVWYDFGDSGGNVIDFIMRYEGLRTVREVLSYLRKLHPEGRRTGHDPNQGSMLSFQKYNHKTADSWDGIDEYERQLEFIEAYPIRDPAIYNYLEQERKIPRHLADLYLVEVEYWNRVRGKQFYAFGMKNESGGYEIRAASSKYNFKSALKKRDITVIKGGAGAPDTVYIYEGMTDFLSHLVLTGTDRLPGDALIMHSVSSNKRSAAWIKDRGYSQINTFLDNNNSGQQKGTARFIADFGDLVTNHSPSFAPHIDLNDALRAGHRLEPLQSNDLHWTP